MANINRILQDIKAKYGRSVARAFADAIADVRSNVVLKRVIDALERGNIDAAIRALNIDETLFASLRAQMVAAYNDGAVAVIAATRFNPPTATRAVVRWDASNPVAERFIREAVGTEITKITNATLEGVREAMAAGYGKGQGPRTIALDVVGRIGANGKRSGGLVGLNGPQVRYVQNMRGRLESGDFTGVMRMTKRDKRFDKTLTKAIREGKPLTKSQINRITTRYSDRLLKLRGDTIARTETAGAVEQSRVDAFRVGMAKENYPPQYVIKEWLHGGGGMKPRIQHMHESGQTVRGLDTPFVMADNTLMQRPHDPEAPAKHVINCTCTLLLDIDWKRMRLDGVI